MSPVTFGEHPNHACIALLMASLELSISRPQHGGGRRCHVRLLVESLHVRATDCSRVLSPVGWLSFGESFERHVLGLQRMRRCDAREE